MMINPLVIRVIFFVVFNLFGLTVFAQRNENTIKIASYNIRMDTKSDGINGWPNRKENVKQLITYHDFDVVGVQEAFYHQLNDMLALPTYAYYGLGREDGKKAGEHAAIFYKKERFVLLDSGDFWLRENPDTPGLGWDATCCNRICSWVKLRDRASKKVFFVFNVHFDHQGVVARRESGKLMVAQIQKIAHHEPVILTGDFNSTPESEQIKTIKGVLDDTFDKTKEKPYGPIGTFNNFRFDAALEERIDYIFVSKKVEVLNYAVLTDSKEQRYPSDHMPVVALVKLP